MKYKHHPNIAWTPQERSIRGVHAAFVRKKSHRDILVRLRDHFLYSKLCSLVPHQPMEMSSSSNMASEFEAPLHEIPSGDCDDEVSSSPPPTNPTLLTERNKAEDREQEYSDDQVCEFDYGSDEDEESKVFVPSIKIKRMDNSLLITSVALKEVALSSSLFCLLEEEKLDILFEDQYRTETRVSHTIQVRIPSEYDTDGLARKLNKWARTGKHA